MKNLFLIMFLLLHIATPSVGQDDGGDMTIAKVWHDGVVSNKLAFDSITVVETYGPVVPGRTVAAIMSIYDSNTETTRYFLTINGVETPLSMPDNAKEFKPTYIGYGNGNLYVVGQRKIINDESWAWNYEYAVWKNMEFQYIMSDSRLVSPYGLDVCVDGNDLYLWGETYLSEQDIANTVLFNFKNDERAHIFEFGGAFEVENGDVYIARGVRFYDSYHSTNSAWTDWGQITQLWKNGTSKNLQRMDRSKLIYTRGMKVHNGVAHIVGYTDLLGGYFNGKTGRLFSAYYYDGNSTHEDPYYSENFDINIDENGNVYIISRRKELDDQEAAFVVLKNGSELYELSDGEPSWQTLFSSGGKLPRIFFDGEDVYVLAEGYHSDDDNNYHYYYMLWKNGQLFWKSDDGNPRLRKMIIY